MSTGVDSQQPPDIQILNSGARQRSVSQSHGSLLPQSVESPQFTDKESVKMVSQSQKSRWLKTGAIIGFIFMLLLWLSPSKSTGYSSYSAGKSSGSSVETKCTKPYDSTKPLIQYALMIDAGSTGSRIHVYRFNNCGPTPELENEVFEQTAKKEGGSSGLSSYKEDAEGAARSLDPLMEVAMSSVPAEYKSCTPIAVKATAGLRFLGAEMSKNILEAVRTRLETVYPFPVVAREKGGVEIMDGSDEGVYAWITTNYLLGKIGGPDENPTAAVFDLGGGSTQIVFQPTFEKSKTGGMPEHLAEGDHKYELKFGGHEFDLYQHSHLGYGLMSARNSMNLVVLDAMIAKNPKDLSWMKNPIANPCIQPNMQKEVKIELPAGHTLGEKEVTVIMAGPQSGGSAAQCRAIAEKILKKDADCTLAPCSFNGVHQPSLEKTFSREDVYIFSYFYDRTNPLGMPSSFTLDELHQLTASVCGGEGSWSVFSGVENALTELRGRPDTCMDLNFMFSLLHTGYEMPLSREVKTAKKIKGNELGWCLGASLPLLSQESGWTCRIKEVS